MKYGFVFPKMDPTLAIDLAKAAKDNRWDVFLVWELVWGFDPWVI